MSLNVGDLLVDAAAVRPAATAVTFGDEEWTYAALLEQAERSASALVASGGGPGKKVAWWSGPSLLTVAGFAGAALSGSLFVPLNPAYGPDEAGAALAYLRPDVLVADAEHVEAARELFDPAATVAIGELADRAGAPARHRGGSDDDAQIVYLTSGTTGRPKGVVVSHRASWLRSFPGGSTFAAGLAGDGGILASFPLFHYGGWHYVLEAWHHRCAFHMCRRFDGPSMLAAAARHRPAALYCIPAVWNRILDERPDPADLVSVRHADTGTSAAPPELLARLQALMPGASTSVLYGSSEGGHHSTLFHRDAARHPGSVGRVAPPGVITLSPGGEILYRSPTLMDGYLDRPEETEAALAGGWYHTGDLGVMDDDGFLYVTGRAREVIRSGGETVAPVEVEQALRGLPGAADLAVVGVPDQTWGEVVCAAVVAAPGDAAPGVAEARRHLGDRLAAYKHPRLVVAVTEVPRTAATGQVQRTLLRDLVVEQLRTPE